MRPAGGEPFPLHDLLQALDEEHDRAGRRLLEIRRKLTTVFESRGFPDPPDLVDRTIERVARKVGTGIDLRTEPFRYFYGVARRVALEAGRQDERRRREQEELARARRAAPAAEDRRQPCFDRCLESLPEGEQDLLFEYFDFRGGLRIARRKALCLRLKISDRALRLRIYRLRGRLVRCVEICLQGETKKPSGSIRK